MTLVVTRRTGQKIKIGDDITITVVRISETSEVRIGIDAPRDIRIERIET